MSAPPGRWSVRSVPTDPSVPPVRRCAPARRTPRAAWRAGWTARWLAEPSSSLRRALRASPFIATVLAAVALAGCGGADEGISGGGKVIGRTVTVYSLATNPGSTHCDFVDAEKLALSDAGGKAGGLLVNFNSLDLGGPDREAQGQAVRRAINDPQIIAAIVDATDVTVPLFNAAGILQVAPGGDLALARARDELPSGKPTVGTVNGKPPDSFRTDFLQAFGREPSAGAVEGYRAMQGVLRAIAQAGARGNDRTRVIEAYGV